MQIMVTTLPKPKAQDKPPRQAQEKPWMAYKKPDGRRNKLFEPGWAGELLDDEVELLQQALLKDSALAY